MKTKIYFLLIILLFPCKSFCNEKDSSKTVRFAVMNFVNYSGDFRATDIMMPLILETAKNKLVNIYDPTQLRTILRKHRIRTAGKISAEAASKIKNELDISYLILGSIDFYKQSEPFEVGVTIRILDLANMKLAYSNSYSATNIEFMKIFGFGRINDIKKLASKVTTKIFEDITIDKLRLNSIANNSSLKIAVVPFDNISRVGRAGEIVSNQVITHLFESGIDVIEPGIVQELMIKSERLSKGQIDLISMNELNKKHGIDLIVTGSVDMYKFARGESGRVSPEVQFGLRVVNAKNGNILFSSNKLTNGAEGENFFQLGKCHSLGQLSKKAVKKVLKKYIKEKGHEL